MALNESAGSLKARRILALVCATILLSASGGALYKFGVDGTPLLCIPSEDISDGVRDITRSSLTTRLSAGRAQLAEVQVAESEIRSKLKEFQFDPEYARNAPINTIQASISFLDEEQRKINLGGAAGPDVVDIWNRSGQCPAPIVTPVPGSGAYLARCEAISAHHILFDTKPDPGAVPDNVYDTVLATCFHTDITFGPHAGHSLESCYRRILIDAYEVDYHFELYNTHIIDNIDRLLEAKVREWERRCDI